MEFTIFPDTWNFKASSSFHERRENHHVTDGHIGKTDLLLFDDTLQNIDGNFISPRIFVP